MERLSIFGIYKIGIGPSNSHTLEPWKTALDFVNNLKGKNLDSLEVHLYGSLSRTSKGHAPNIAVQLGLEGFDPTTITTDEIVDYIFRIKVEEIIIIVNLLYPIDKGALYNYPLPIIISQ